MIFGILVLSTAAQPNFLPPAILQIEGEVYLDQAPVRLPVNLTGDAVIRTGAGRVEIRLSDGSLLFLGENSSARVTARQQNMAKSRLEVMDGSAVVATGTSDGLMECEDAVTLSDHAVVRLDVHPVTAINSFTGLPYGGHFCGIKVYEGAAAAQLRTVATVLRAGRRAQLNRLAADRIPLYDFDTAQLDALDRWSREQAR